MGSHHVIVAAALIGGCTLPPHSRVDGWPEMQTAVHVVEPGEIFGRCYRYLPTWAKMVGGLPLACAEVNWQAAQCHIYIAEPIDHYTLEHELLHCAGWDHDGILRDGLARWRATLTKEQ